ncbi:MAG: tetratricopeptide repeat protein [Gammaproteobacteria bacterium]|nr:tetratricopeptide repeat protein [Gammaproteobacteria bacterium]MDH3766895.1 tetratricopeptide repeat protein [Gammaproteobacteria bacterium]
MSLVNEMLKDLQERKAPDAKPLAGLRVVRTTRPVSSVPPKRLWYIAASAGIIVAAVALFWPRTEATRITSQPIVLVQPKPVPAVVPQISATTETVETKPDLALSYQLSAPLKLLQSATPQIAAVRTEPKPNSATLDQPSAPVRKKTTATVAASAAPPQTVTDAAAVNVKSVVAPEVRLRREGLAALRSGRPTEAEREFRELVTIDPRNSESHLLLHRAVKAQPRRGGTARGVLLSGLDSATDPLPLVQVLARELLDADQITQALVLLETHRPADQTNLEFEALLAAAHQRAGDHESAQDVYEFLVGREPGNGVWWVGLAISQEANGRTRDARKSFETATLAGTLDDTLARYAHARLVSLENGS